MAQIDRTLFHSLRLFLCVALSIRHARAINNRSDLSRRLNAQDRDWDAEVACPAESNLKTPSGFLRTSLLQRGFSRTLQTSSRASSSNVLPCKGFETQGKCWYLSGIGESCAKTCARHGQVFSFALADASNPIIAGLVGAEPRAKQEAWAALECYVADEDRYHIASAKAAQGSTSDLGTWSYKTCQLSCPCDDAGECAWKQPPACARQFEWKGSTYEGCTSVDSDIPWCQHHHHHLPGTAEVEEDLRDWSYCVYECAPEVVSYPVEDHCSWTLPHVCVTEFDYENAHYVGCTTSEHSTPWCSLTETYAGFWATCMYSCDDGKKSNTANSSIVSAQDDVSAQDNVICTWQPASECRGWFLYKGINYTGCTEEGHGMPWCSHDNVHGTGSFGEGWSQCTRVCTEEATTTLPLTSSSQTSITPFASKACVRWDHSGWHEGDWKRVLPASQAPDGKEWTWQQCAKECGAASVCEFWTLQFHLHWSCHLMANQGKFHPDDVHIEGPRVPFCEEVDLEAM